MNKTQINEEKLKNELTACRDILPVQDQAILDLYYGLGNVEPLGLREIATKLEIRPEKAHQTQMRCLDYLTQAGYLPSLTN